MSYVIFSVLDGMLRSGKSASKYTYMVERLYSVSAIDRSSGVNAGPHPVRT